MKRLFEQLKDDPMSTDRTSESIGTIFSIVGAPGGGSNPPLLPQARQAPAPRSARTKASERWTPDNLRKPETKRQILRDVLRNHPGVTEAEARAMLRDAGLDV
jgi:hypothetical protein